MLYFHYSEHAVCDKNHTQSQQNCCSSTEYRQFDESRDLEYVQQPSRGIASFTVINAKVTHFELLHKSSE